MKKKIFMFILAFALVLPSAFLLSACGEKTIRNVYTQLGDSLETSRNLGGFEFTTGVQPAMQELGKLTIVVEYSDNSKTSVKLDDEKLNCVIEYDGSIIDSFPSVMDCGNYTVKFSYDNKPEYYAEVNFHILASSSANYRISGISSGWQYLEMPDLISNVNIINYTGADSVTDFYYIDKSTYTQIINNDPTAFDDVYNLPQEMKYLSYTGDPEQDVYTKIPAGSWYLFARVPYTLNYNAQLTAPHSITVAKSNIDRVMNINGGSDYSITAEYTYNGTIVGPVALSEITPNLTTDLYGYNSEHPEITVSLGINDWAYPEQTVSLGSTQNNAQVKFKILGEEDANNFNLTGDAFSKSVEITLNAGKVAYPDFDDNTTSSQPGFKSEVTTTKEKQEFVGVDYFRDGDLYVNDFTDRLDYFENYFNVVELYDVTDPENEQKVNIYFADGTPYFENANYNGSVKVVLYFNSDSQTTYAPKIEIDNNAIGEYKLEFRLKDTDNYVWEKSTDSHETDVIKLNINITKNSIDERDYYLLSDALSVDTEGYIELEVNVSADYFTTKPTSDDITFKTLLDTQVQGVTTNVTVEGDPTVESVTEYTEGTDSVWYKIKIKVKVILKEVYNNNLCFELKIATAEDFEDIDMQDVVTISRI